MQVNDKSTDTRISLLELQIGRMVADMESEKVTRSRVTTEIQHKLDTLKDSFRDAQDKTNRILYMMVGGLMLMEVVLQFIRPLFAR